MSIIGSISNCRKPIGEGADRLVFYSKRYKCIIKKDKVYPEFSDRGEQMEHEFAIFQQMTDEEKKVYPIINIVEYQGEKVILMKKCKPIHTFQVIMNMRNNCEIGDIQTYESACKVCMALSLEMDSAETYHKFIKKYQLRDMHIYNVGVYENRLVVLDAGY